MNGVINVLKPTGMSSHDVVSFIRKITGIKKVGHAGTLDPNVSGVLPICIGKGTKLSDLLINGDKEYVCEIIFGKKTDTEDMYGNIVKENSIDTLNKEKVLDAIYGFKGVISQVPPAYSAVKINGKKLYEYARDNVEIEKEARNVEIKNIEVLKIDLPKALFKVMCSKGTYMRTLCKDIGEKLGVGAHMGILIRTSAKGLNITDSYSLEELKALADFNNFNKCIISFENIIPLKKVYVKDELYDKLVVGNEIHYTMNNFQIADQENFYVYCKNSLLGIGHVVNDKKIKIHTMLF